MGVLKNKGLEYLWTQILAKFDTKVDKVEGKNLSTNDYTNDDKNKVNSINNKVDKISGKSLSTNDYTTTEKDKLAGIQSGANKTVVDSSLSSTSTNPVQNKIVKTELDKKFTTTYATDGFDGTARKSGIVTTARSSGLKIVGSNSELIVCPASPPDYKANSSSNSDEINPKTNEYKPIVPYFLDYAVTSATHQKMSDSYNPANATNDTPAYSSKTTSAYRDYAGKQPVSYDAVKGYVDGIKSNVQTQLDKKAGYIAQTTDIGEGSDLDTGVLYLVYEN